MPANDLTYFARRMSKIAQGVDKASTEVVRNLLRNMGPALGYSTPVDTSRARANWQAALGTAPTSYLYAKPAAPPSAAAGASAAIQSLSTIAALYRPGVTVYVVNNAPYITDLNNGTSSQAPAGFVQIAIHVAIKSIRSVRWIR